MTEKENPWFSPDRPSALIPPPTTAGSPLLRPPDPPFASQFSSLQQTLASPPLSKKQIFRALGTASLAQVESSASTFSASLAQDPVPITDRVPVIRSDLTLSASAVTTKDQFKGFIVHIPKKSLPFPSNSASSSRKHPGTSTHPKTNRKEHTNYPLPPQQNTHDRTKLPQTTNPHLKNTKPMLRKRNQLLTKHCSDWHLLLTLMHEFLR